MSTSEQDMLQDLLATFQAEAADLLQTLNSALLQLERAPDEEARRANVQEAFRAAHSLKGAALAVGLEAVKDLAHDIESVLQDARDADRSLKAATCDVLYDALDTIEQLLAGNEVDTASIHDRLLVVGNGGGAAPVAAPAAPAEPEAPMTATINEDTIRVSVSKLDDLMAQAGELLVSKIGAEQRLVDMQSIRRQMGEWSKLWRDLRGLLPRLEGEAGHDAANLILRYQDHFESINEAFNKLHQSINRDTIRLGMVADQLQDEVRRVRMVPFSTLELALQRSVRDTGRGEDKPVRLHVEGGEVELDKRVLEELKAPLLHLLRNAVSHGIEDAATRQAAGKPREGRVTITVQQRGGDVRIIVADDGRGFDLEALRGAAARHNLPLPDDAAATNELLMLAFRPGISTAKHITAMSGRGVGLDVVRQSLEALQGRIEVESDPDNGSAIHLTVPLSLSITRGLLVRVGKERYALPLLAVEKIVEPTEVFTVEGRSMLTIDGTPLPLVRLDALLERKAPTNGDRATPEQQPLAVVMGVAEQRQALLVDDVLTEQELAIKALGNPLKRVRNVAGAALLGDGQPVVILNAADLIKSAQGALHVALPNNGREREDTGPVAHILVVDDSITTRTLEKNILEAAGYRVTTATDGIEALRQLENNAIDLIVADVQMPNMDGIDFTEAVRESAAFQSLPLILVTSLESREDRERGMVAGADAYIVKRGFDQAELLSLIEQFLL